MTELPITPDVNPDALLAILDRQCELYGKLKALSDHQSDMVRRERTGPLLQILGQRQQVIQELTSLSESFSPYRQRWPQMRDSLDAAVRSRIEQGLDQVERLLSQIIEQDEADRQRLEQAHVALSKEIQQTAHAGAAVAAYRNANTNVARTYAIGGSTRG